MLIGAHAILYSTDADADRDFLQKVLKLPSVDVGHGWLIFGLPPAEVAIHPAESASHKLYLMVDDVAGFVADMKAGGFACDEVSAQGWGMLTAVHLPGGGKLGVYQPRHARPPQASPKAARASGKKAAPAKKKPAKAAVKAAVKPKPKAKSKRK